MKDETKCLHAGYTPENGGARVMPIYQSTSFVFDSSEDFGSVFDEPTKSVIYSRFANPTVMAVENKIAELEGGVGAMCTSSGQAATLLSLINILGAGDSFICTTQVYGGTHNLVSRTLKKFGIECILIDTAATKEEINASFKPNTKAVFGEMLANPTLTVLDVERFAKVAHANGVPLIVDNTLPTPVFCKPFEFGADIVVHSTSKYMDGHSLQCGGAIVDSGNFDWANGKFPEFTEPDESYHGIVYVKDYKKAAYIIKARMQLVRDFGVYPAAHSAFLLNIGLETLSVRMERHAENALKVAEYFSKSDKIESVNYPGLKNDKYHELANKYLKSASGVVSLIIKGGKSNAVKFMDGLKLASTQAHMADIRTCVLHPASSTHRQLSKERLRETGVDPGLIRFSVGIENIDDIIADIEQSLKNL